MWIFIALGVGILALAHTAPAPFLFDAIAGRRALWHMPRTDPPTIYLTFDDGPNPTTTPDLLDVLAHEGAHATFFLIDRHITDATTPDTNIDNKGEKLQIRFLNGVGNQRGRLSRTHCALGKGAWGAAEWQHSTPKGRIVKGNDIGSGHSTFAMLKMLIAPVRSS